MSAETRKSLKTAYRIIFMSGLTTARGLERAEAECEDLPEVKVFLDFIRSSERGITR